MQKVLLSTAYLPNLTWFHYFLSAGKITIEKHEHFIKQSYRNRCEILSANGKLSLSIPLIKQSDKEIISEKKISYSEKWQIRHWRAITSAYKNSPYFEFFEDELRPFYFSKYDYLFDYNTKLIEAILKIWRTKKEILFTNEYTIEPDCLDLRNIIHPKKKTELLPKPYHQVFDQKFGFISDLSVIDLLFNQGLNSMHYLTDNL